MRRFLTAVALSLLGFWGLGVGTLRADNLPVPKGPDEDGTKPALVKIAGEGLMDSHAYQYLTELSDDIGARVTGTPEDRKAEDWGVAKMKAMGLENVHAEKYKIWRSWTGSTPAGGVEGDSMTVNVFDLDNEIKNVSRLKGKVALALMRGNPNKPFIEIFAQFGDFLRAAGTAGAIAIIGGQGGIKSSGMNLTQTGILGFDADFAIPVVSMTAEDQGQLERFLERGITPRVRFNVQNTFTNGPVETANVVGEIRGREHPEEIFVVGAHLDSWDLAQGATDNGSGTATVLWMTKWNRARTRCRFHGGTAGDQSESGLAGL